METIEQSQTRTTLPGITWRVIIPGRGEVVAFFEGRVLRLNGRRVVDRSRLDPEEALVASLDVFTRAHCPERVEEALFLLMFIETIRDGQEDGETFRQTPLSRIDSDLRIATERARQEAMTYLRDQQVQLGQMIVAA